jgi:hypothetical protein
MAVAVAIASPRMVLRWMAIQRIADPTPWGFGGGSFCLLFLLHAKRSNSERAMADERATTADDSTDTLERHVTMTSCMTRNKNVGTRGVLAGGGAVAYSVRTGRSMVPKTPLSSKNEVERVTVSRTWTGSCWGSQMARGSMHIAK